MGQKGNASAKPSEVMAKHNIESQGRSKALGTNAGAKSGKST
jgi:hypothetical protein